MDKRPKIGEILLDRRRITEMNLQDGLEKARSSRRRLGEVLVEMGVVSDVDVAQALALQFGLEYLDPLKSGVVRKDLRSRIPDEIIRKSLVIPVSEEETRLKILMHDPLDFEITDSLRFRLDRPIDVAVGSKTRIQMYIDELFGVKKNGTDKALSGTVFASLSKLLPRLGGYGIPKRDSTGAPPARPKLPKQE